MAKKEPEYDPMSVGHHTTKDYGWGYDVLKDGSIKIAPCMAEPMRKVLDTASGLEDMQEAVVKFVAREMAALNKTRREWWTRTGNDLGIDLRAEPGWSFDPVSGMLKLIKPEVPTATPSP